GRARGRRGIGRADLLGAADALHQGAAGGGLQPRSRRCRRGAGIGMPRALVVVLDSVGIGGAEDAAAYGDEGADTVGHIAEACARGDGDRVGLREGPLHLPNLVALGLGLACEASSGRMPPNLDPFGAPAGAWGYGVETSKGKDTPSGHWEIAGVPVTFDWG